MNLLEAIETRHSVRTFNGLRPDTTILDNIRRECERLTARENLPSCFSTTDLPVLSIINTDVEGQLGTYGVIRGARTYAAMGYVPTHDAMLLAGFIFEKLILYCTANEIDTCWIGGTFSQRDFRKAISAINANEEFAIGVISPIGHATQKTRFAERIMRKFANSNSRKPFEKLFTGIEPPTETMLASSGNCDLKPLPIDDAVRISLEMVRLAPSSRNSQPWRAAVTRQNGNIVSVDFRCTTDNKFSSVDMGIALCHFFNTISALGHSGTVKLRSDKSSPAFSWEPV